MKRKKNESRLIEHAVTHRSKRKKDPPPLKASLTRTKTIKLTTVFFSINAHIKRYIMIIIDFDCVIEIKVCKKFFLRQLVRKPPTPIDVCSSYKLMSNRLFQ